MYSFYGGRPGNSFVIVATYESVADMVANFKLGPNYADVHYDEHVIINTINKNNPENGKIYRRGYDFNNEMGGAEYIGTIVGPAGNAPMLEMTTIQDINSKAAEESYQERFSSGTYTPEDENLVPGKNSDGTFNDNISWACYSVRDANHEDTVAYIGFKIPYLVIDFQSSQVEPYVNGVYEDVSSVTRVDDGQHPFYQKLQINIPKGVKGDALKNLRVVTATTDIEPYQGQADDVNLNRKVLVYDYYDYTNNQDGSPKKIYLGDYNMIEDISIDENGTIEIDYSHEATHVWNKKFKWIKSVSLNENTGAFKVIYNQSTDASGQATEYNVQLDWVKDISVNDDGTVTFNYTKSADKTYNNLIKWITGITLLNDGTMQVQWNTGATDTVFDKIVKWISSVDIANDGTITINYNNGTTPTVLSKAIKWIDNVTLADNGTLTFTYNNDSNPTIFTNIIKTLTDIKVNTGDVEGTGSQKIAVKWNYLNQEVQIGNPINYIMQAAVDEYNHLLIKYSDPEKRAAGGITYNNSDGWTNVGTIAPAVNDELARYVIEDYNQTEIGGSYQTIEAALNNIRAATSSGQPTIIESASQMTDPQTVYLYQGNEDGYSHGYLYYFSQDQFAWIRGASYGNSSVDSQMSNSSPNPVQNRAITAAIANLEARIEELENQAGSSSSGNNQDYIIDMGTVTMNSIAAGKTATTTVPFSKVFTSKPTIFVSIAGKQDANVNYAKIAARVLENQITSTGFQFYVANTANTAFAPKVNWIAIQAAATT